MFYELLSVVSFGIRPLLDSSMDLINATEPEREAIKKAQDCFIDTGVFNMFNHAVYVVIYLPPIFTLKPHMWHIAICNMVIAMQS